MLLPHMQIRSTRSTRQDGAALLVLLVIVIIAATGVLLNSLNRASVATERDRITAEALAQAKEALIGNAVGVNLDGDTRPGDLPCPAPDSSGIAATSCGNAAGITGQTSRLGRLPWKTLGLPDLRDGYGEQLWYAVSNNFKNNARTSCTSPGQPGCLNSDTRGTITVRNSSGVVINNGSNPDVFTPNGVAAVVIAPGAALQRQGGSTLQDRSATGASTPQNYLDIGNGEDNAAFIDSSATDGFINGPTLDAGGNTIVNDRLITITYQDLMPKLEKRMAREVSNCLKDYAADPLNQGRLPWAASLSTATSPSYDDVSGTRFGRLPDTFTNTITDSGMQMKDGWTGSCNLNLGSWWNNWREMVFYAVADAYKPQPTPLPACGTCLTINPPSATADKQFAVFVAGRRLSGIMAGQPRTSNVDKGTIANYLENQNAIGDPYTQGLPTPTFNDVVVYQ